MWKKLAILTLVLAAGAALFAFYPRLSAQFDDDGAAYHQVADVQGDRVRIDRDGKQETLAVATFAGGCFWCVEDSLELVPGVWSAVSGYSGGKKPNPTYEQVAYGRTSYTESVQVYFDPEIISYEGLLQAFWRAMDPTDNDGQFSDRGKQYRPVIFYHSEKQRAAAERSRIALDKSARFPDPVIIPIEPYKNFYMAEDYHQDFSRKNPLHYLFYTHGSGRGPFVEKIWGEDQKLDYSKYGPDATKAQKTSTSPTEKGQQGGGDFTDFKKPTDEALKKRLTLLQYRVTQEEGTEPPFDNEYWDDKRDGIYVDVVSGEPLFSSKDKFKSGTGWPSFTRPLLKSTIVEKTDRKLFTTRTEVRSRLADSHLGHVFDDGPAPTGLRYCINSAALRFVPADKLGEEGYSRFADRFAAN